MLLCMSLDENLGLYLTVTINYCPLPVSIRENQQAVVSRNSHNESFYNKCSV